MSSALATYPFDSQRCVGTICEVGPTFVKANLPSAALAEGQWYHGNRLGVGEVGEFIIVEGGEVGVVGRIINVRLPERDRLAVETELGTERNAHPIGTIQLLTTIRLSDPEVVAGIPVFPRLGAKVYSLHPETMKWLAESSASGQSKTPSVVLDLAFLPAATNTQVRITPERIFGRHCAILGATGGGKSWTVARLIEQAAIKGAKIILLDATGEFHRLDCRIKHVHIGEDRDATSTEVALPHTELTESDILALFKPSGQTQAPKLRLAMKSLKLARLEPGLTRNGVLFKAKRSKKEIIDPYRKHVSAIEAPRANFDVQMLVQQISEECVYAIGGTRQEPDPTCWGEINDTERSYCVTLITRIEELLHSAELSCIFRAAGKPSLLTEIQNFMASDDRVLRISLKSVPFSHNAREIIANAIGRHLLTEARASKFKATPIIVFLDEAHQFLDKSLGDENTKYPLDSFDLIAKEGRKFCLNICIATQRPRDVPEGVLSQMGTLIVHRLVNDKDREIVERASGEIDRSAAEFLPTLAPGQAVIIGADFPMPLTVQMHAPNRKPDSQGPDFQSCWKA